jgi:small conductance mechanosensitive channel
MFGIEWLNADWIEKFVIPSVLGILSAIVVFLAGMWLAGRIRNVFSRMLSRSRLDPILVRFFSDILYWTLLIVVSLAAIDRFGVNVTSVLAVIGAAGLAVALALKDSLSNFAAGVMLIIFRPFTLDDFVEAGGVAGSVEETGLFSTTMLTPDNKRIFVPNSAIFSGTIINYSAKPNRRVDLVVGISYNDDIRKAKSIVEQLFKEDARILEEPEPMVTVASLGDSSVNLNVRPWVKKVNYWGVHSDIQQAIKERFDQEGITIPFPQRDIHVFNELQSGD